MPAAGTWPEQHLGARISMAPNGICKEKTSKLGLKPFIKDKQNFKTLSKYLCEIIFFVTLTDSLKHSESVSAFPLKCCQYSTVKH